MSEFPTSDADIKALRVKILRALAASPHPRMAIGSVAGHNGLTVDDVKSLIKDYGWPEPHDMARHVLELQGQTPPAPPRPAQPTPQPPAAQGNGTERLLDAADKSSRARTRNLAAKIREHLKDLRELVILERREAEAADAAAAERARLKAEVDELEKQLAQKKALLKPSTPKKTTPKASAGNRVIRDWAAAHGVACPSFGRIPRDVVEVYELATKAAS